MKQQTPGGTFLHFFAFFQNLVTHISTGWEKIRQIRIPQTNLSKTSRAFGASLSVIHSPTSLLNPTSLFLLLLSWKNSKFLSPCIYNNSYWSMIWQNSSCRSLSRFRLALFQRARCTPLSLANTFIFRCCKCPKTWTFEQKFRWLSFQLAVTTWLKSWCLSHIASKRKGGRWTRIKAQE